MGWVVNTTPRPHYHQGKNRYPLYRKLDGPQGRSGRVRKISHSPRFGTPTVQAVGSRYTDWAIPAHHFKRYVINICQISKLIYGSLNSLQFCYRSVPNILPCLLQLKQPIHFSSVCVWKVVSNFMTVSANSVTVLHDGFGGLVVIMLASGTQVCGFKSGRSRWIFAGVKILSMPSSGGEVKESVPCPIFVACKRT